jgi:hypothetical protein
MAETLNEAGESPQTCIELESSLVRLEQEIEEIEEEKGGYAD